MRIKWYGTASLLVESNDTWLLIDPYLKNFNPKLYRVPVEEAAQADAAVITHPHLDHFCDIKAFLDAGLSRVYVSQNGIDHAREQGIPVSDMVPLCAGEVLKIGNLTVRTYQSKHCKFDLWTVLGVALSPLTYFRFSKGVSLIKATKRYKITQDIYALEITDGEKTVMVLGSAGMDETQSYPTGADLFVFPYQGRTRMHRYLQKFLKVLRPKAVMADHFDNAFPPFTHTMNMKRFVPTVQNTLPNTTAFVPKEGEWYEV